MKTRFDAAINGTWLSEIDDSVAVTDVREDMPDQSLVTAEKGMSAGSRFIRRKRRSAAVHVSFVIWEQDTERRREIAERVQRWALSATDQPARLETMDRNGQELLVRCTEPLVIGSAMRYSEELTLTFTAFEVPVWRDLLPLQAAITESGTLYLPGIGETLVDAEITNNGGTIQSLSVACGSTALAFDGLNMANGQTLVIGHDDLGILSAKVNGVSVLNRRTPESADDLIALCGVSNLISVSGGTVSAVFKARGVYL